MRYFTKELLLKINDCDKNVRIKAEEEWHTNSMAYQKQFEKTKETLSRRFVKDYLQRKGLHDYLIKDIVITKRHRTYLCEISLSNSIEDVLLTIVGLKAVHIDIASFLHCIQGKITWGYSEFEITPENNITLAVLCDEQNEMRFEFETIKLIKGRRKHLRIAK